MSDGRVPWFWGWDAFTETGSGYQVVEELLARAAIATAGASKRKILTS